jgi:tetratricopeptide (TPR) repeat protein
MNPREITPSSFRSDYFVNRLKEIEFFKNQVARYTIDPSGRIIAWHGVGGQGKSALFHKFRQVLESADTNHKLEFKTISCAIDLTTLPAPIDVNALFRIRTTLGKKLKKAMPAFDIAFLRLQAKLNPGLDLRAAFPEIFEFDSQLFGEGLSFVGDVVKIGEEASDGIPGLAFVYKSTTRLTGSFKRWLAQKGSNILKGLDDLDLAQLITNLPFYLASDINHFIDGKKSITAVILFDGLDALPRINEAKSLPRIGAGEATWLQSFIREAHSVQFHLFSRDKIAVSNLLRTDKHKRYRRIGNLSNGAVSLMLSHAGIEDKVIRNLIVAGAKGLPFYVELQIQLFDELRRSGDFVNPELFGGPLADVIERLMSHLSIKERDALGRLCLVEIVDYKSLDFLLRAFPELSDFHIQCALGRSFFAASETEPKQWYMHDLLKTHLRAALQAQSLRSYQRSHEILFGLLDAEVRSCEPKHVSDEDVRHFLNASFHLSEFAPKDLANWVLSKSIPLQISGRWNDLLGPLHLAEEICRQDANPSELAHILAILAKSNLKLGLGLKALDLVNSAIEIGVGSTSIDADDLARWILYRGSVHYLLQNFELAREDYIRVEKHIAESKNDTMMMELGECLHNLGTVCHSLSKFQDAKKFYQRALDLTLQVEGTDSLNIPSRLAVLAGAQWALGDTEEAIKNWSDSIREAIRLHGENSEYTARARNALGRVLRDLGELDEGFDNICKAVDSQRKLYGNFHPELGHYLTNLAQIQIDKGEIDAAANSIREAISILETLCSNEHTYLALAYDVRVNILKKLNRFDEALTEQTKIYKRMAKLRGPEHEWSILFLAKTGELHYQRKSYAIAVKILTRSLRGLSKLGQEQGINAGFIRMWLGECFLGLKDKARALRELTSAESILNRHGACRGATAARMTIAKEDANRL